MIKNLKKNRTHRIKPIAKNTIIIAERLAPADIAQIDPAKVIGIVAMLGGVDGHSAIMARALGLPCVLGATSLLTSIQSGDPIIIDGILGRVFSHPTKARRQQYKKLHSIHETKK